MKVRVSAALLASAGAAAIAWWALTSHAGTAAIFGGLTVPLGAFWLLVLGFFTWLAGMVRAERSSWRAWSALETRIAPAGYLDTAVLARIGIPQEPVVSRAPTFDPGPIAVSRPRPHTAASPVALAVLDTIELRRLETGEQRQPRTAVADAPSMPLPATAAARARA